MPWYAAAVVAGAYIGSESADRSSRRAERAANTELGFQQERYDDWMEVFGPIQDNLSEYYNNLSADYFEAVGIEAFEKERALALAQVEENLAQRGITDSGLAADLRKDLALEAAQTRAQIRRDAPRLAAEDKSRFLQIGMGLNPAESLAATLANRTDQLSREARSAQAASAQITADALSTAGTALADYFNEQPSTTPSSNPGGGDGG